MPEIDVMSTKRGNVKISPWTRNQVGTSGLHELPVVLMADPEWLLQGYWSILYHLCSEIVRAGIVVQWCSSVAEYWWLKPGVLSSQ